MMLLKRVLCKTEAVFRATTISIIRAGLCHFQMLIIKHVTFFKVSSGFMEGGLVNYQYLIPLLLWFTYKNNIKQQRTCHEGKTGFFPSRHTTLNKRLNNVVFLRWINVDFELDMEVETTLKNQCWTIVTFQRLLNVEKWLFSCWIWVQ